jgi:cytochrome c oxidase subunit 4
MIAHVKIYLIVFAALIVGTAVTVAVANVKIGVAAGIAAAMAVAAIKGSLVAGFFMHLFRERKLVYWLVALTAFLLAAMIGLIMLTQHGQQGHHVP